MLHLPDTFKEFISVLLEHNYKNHTDEELLLQIVNKQSKPAFNFLYQKYAHVVLGICIKYLSDVHLAQDAVQAIFIKVWTESAKYQVRQFRPWLNKVAKNYCLMELRKTNPTYSFDEKISDEFMDSEQDLHRKIKDEYLLQLMEKCLNKLNDYQQVCIKYFYLQQKTYSEVAGLLDFSVTEVKSYLQNGRRNLKNCVNNRWISENKSEIE